MYVYTQKRGRWRYGLASWTGGPNTCLAAAEDVFAAHGLKGGDTQRDDVRLQKNWAGFGPGALLLTDTEEEAWAHGERRRARVYRGMDCSWADFRNSQEPKIVTREEYEAMT